jgi:signal transduction histidine kinase
MVALALVVAMAAGWWLLQRSLTSAAQDSLSARAAEVAVLVGEEGTPGLSPQRQPVFGEVIQVLDPSGQVLAAAPPSAAALSLVSSPPRAKSLVTRVHTLLRSGYTEPYLVATLGARDAVTGRDVVVVVARTASHLSETLEAVARLGLVGVPLLVLVTAGVTYLFTGRALAPVEAMRRRVLTITSQRLDERVPVPVVHDEIGRLAVTMNDMLASLQAAQGAQRRFVADAGHELRSPLAVIATTVEVARSDEPTGSDRAQLLDDVAAETSRMSRLVDDLLLLARADEHGLLRDGTDVDLDDLLEAEGRRLRTMGHLEVSVRTEPVRVTGDRDRLAQVVRNLTDNAQRHAVHRLRLQLQRDGSQAVIRVEDDGPGIAAEDRERVFGRFVRLDASRQRGSGGSGLGLAIVREIVVAHGGRVELGASDLGGTAAEVRLPATEA